MTDFIGSQPPDRRVATSRSLALWFAILLALVFTAPIAGAQDISALTGSDVAPSAEPSKPDAYGRDTPRGLANGLIDALGAQDYARAAKFLDLSAIAPEEQIAKGPLLAERLQQALDKGGSLTPFTALSSDPAGVLDDGLDEQAEVIGAFRGVSGETPLVAVRRSEVGITAHWLISSESLDALPLEESVARVAAVESVLPDVVKETRVAGAPVADWLILGVIALVSYAAMRAIFWFIMTVVRRFVRNSASYRFVQFLDAAIPPLRMYLAVIAFFLITQEMEVAIVARQALSKFATIFAWVAFVWFLWRLIDFIAELWTGRMRRLDRRRAASLTTFLRRSAKLLLGFIAFFAVLDTIGVDVTTGIAALGIGGLALALGAQKTIENVVGSLTVIVDQPARVGDFCRIGDVSGTVEDIGMRSTRIRTNKRTLVTIPNGAFASMQIENLSRRDRILFNPVIGLTYDTSADKMRLVLSAIRSVLEADEDIIDDEARVRFIEFNASSLDVEIFAYFQTFDYPTSLAMREELMLKIMDAIEDADASIAFPTQTLLLRPETAS